MTSLDLYLTFIAFIVVVRKDTVAETNGEICLRAKISSNKIFSCWERRAIPLRPIAGLIFR